MKPYSVDLDFLPGMRSLNGRSGKLAKMAENGLGGRKHV